MEKEILEIIDRYTALIKHIILGNIHRSDSIDPEDIEQEVKIKIWKSLQKGKDIRNLSSYISKIAYSITVDELRKMKKQNPPKNASARKHYYLLTELLHNHNDMTPQNLIEEKEQIHEMNQAIESLSPNRKQVLRLYAEGFSIEEICEFFQWGKVKVRHLLYRGIDDLRRKHGTKSAFSQKQYSITGTDSS